MLIPNAVRILGQSYSIEILPKKDMPGMLGFCDTNSNTVKLRKTLKGDKLDEIFLHECIHAIDEQMGLNMKEKQVNGIAVGMLAFLKDNGYV